MPSSASINSRQQGAASPNRQLSMAEWRVAIEDTLADLRCMIDGLDTMMGERHLRSKSRLTTLNESFNSRLAELGLSLSTQVANVCTLEESCEARITALEDALAGSREEVLQLKQEVREQAAIIEQLQQGVSHHTASAVAGCLPTEEIQVMIEAALKERQVMKTGEPQQQKQQELLSTVMVQVDAHLTPEQAGKKAMEAAGLGHSAVVSVSLVASRGNSSSYAAATRTAACLATPGGGESTSGGVMAGKGSSKKGDGSAVGKTVSLVASRGNSSNISYAVATSTAEQATPGGGDGTSGGVMAGKGSSKKGGGSAGGKAVSAVGAAGKVWMRLQLASPHLGHQLLRQRKALREAGVRAEEALSKEEYALKRQYLDRGIPAKVWEAEAAPVSWRRGNLVKLARQPGQQHGKWVDVPLDYALQVEK